jgi:Fe-S-cluster containining protein
MSIRCPHLNEQELCSIYETRPSCCRNFPNRNEGMFCSDSYKTCVYDSQGNLDCASCKDKCCNHLEIAVFDIKLLDISCAECKEKYCSSY